MSHLMSLCYVNIYHKNFFYGGLLKVIVLCCVVLCCVVLCCVVLCCVVLYCQLTCITPCGCVWRRGTVTQVSSGTVMTHAVDTRTHRTVLCHAPTTLLHAGDALRPDECRQVDDIVLIPWVHSQVPQTTDEEVLGRPPPRPQVPGQGGRVLHAANV